MPVTNWPVLKLDKIGSVNVATILLDVSSLKLLQILLWPVGVSSLLRTNAVVKM